MLVVSESSNNQDSSINSPITNFFKPIESKENNPVTFHSKSGHSTRESEATTENSEDLLTPKLTRETNGYKESCVEKTKTGKEMEINQNIFSVKSDITIDQESGSEQIQSPSLSKSNSIQASGLLNTLNSCLQVSPGKTKAEALTAMKEKMKELAKKQGLGKKSTLVKESSKSDISITRTNGQIVGNSFDNRLDVETSVVGKGDKDQANLVENKNNSAARLVRDRSSRKSLMYDGSKSVAKVFERKEGRKRRIIRRKSEDGKWSECILFSHVIYLMQCNITLETMSST